MKITIAFGWGMTNIGDAAITPGMLNTLKKNFPDADINIITSSYMKGSEEFNKFVQYIHGHLPQCNIWENVFKKFICNDEVNTWLSAAAISTRTPQVMRRLFAYDSEFASMFMTTDLLVLNSGMMLSYNKMGQPNAHIRLISLWMPLLLARALDIPYVLWGQSFGPFHAPADDLAVRIIKDALYTTTRETESLELVRSMGINNSDSDFGSDTTIAFTASDENFASRFILENNLEDNKFAVFIIRTYAWWGKRVDPERRKRHMNFIAAGIEHCIKKLGLKVVIAPEVVREINAARESLIPLISKECMNRIVFMDKFWLPEQAKSLYSRAAILSTMELHSVFLAAPEGTPIVHVFFEEMGPKTNAVRDLGLSDYVIDIDEGNTDRYCEMFSKIMSNQNSIRAKVLAGAKSFKDSVDLGMQEVVKRYNAKKDTMLSPF